MTTAGGLRGDYRVICPAVFLRNIGAMRFGKAGSADSGQLGEGSIFHR